VPKRQTGDRRGRGEASLTLVERSGGHLRARAEGRPLALHRQGCTKASAKQEANGVEAAPVEMTFTSRATHTNCRLLPSGGEHACKKLAHGVDQHGARTTNPKQMR
jgi:hypothetical protein